MPDIGALTAVITSIKAATDLAKIINGADLSLEKAEMKLKIADLITALADAQIALSEVQDTIKQRDDKIKELEEAFELKNKLIRIRDAYYEIDEAGKPFGPPYCSHCWEGSKKTIHLYFKPHKGICPHCKTEYSHNNTPRNPHLE